MTITESFSRQLHWLRIDHWRHPLQRETDQRHNANVCRLQEKLCQWQAIRRLQAMDDDSLQDIGIERYQIKEFVQNFCCQGDNAH